MESQTKLFKEQIEQVEASKLLAALTPVNINKSITKSSITSVNKEILGSIFDGPITSGTAEERIKALISKLQNILSNSPSSSISDNLKKASGQQIILDAFRQYGQGSSGVLLEYLMTYLLGAEYVAETQGSTDFKIGNTNIQLKTIQKRQGGGGIKVRLTYGSTDDKQLFIPETIILLLEKDNLKFYHLQESDTQFGDKTFTYQDRVYTFSNISDGVLTTTVKFLSDKNPTEFKIEEAEIQQILLNLQISIKNDVSTIFLNANQLVGDLFNIFYKKQFKSVELANDKIKQIQTTLSKVTQASLTEALEEGNPDESVKDIIEKAAEDLNIVSVTPNKKVDFGYTVRFESPEDLESGIKQIKKLLSSKGYSTEDRSMPKIDPANDVTDVTKSDSAEITRLVYKYQIGQREGLAVEHIVAYHLTGEVTNDLKDRLDLNPDATPQEVKRVLSDEFEDASRLSMLAASKIEKEVGDVVKADSVGSTGNKADLVLETDSGKKYGLSIKYSSTEDKNKYKVNKNLGYGDDKSELVYNPKGGVAWWIVGRKLFIQKLKSSGSFSGKEYNPKSDEFEAPEWMHKAKEDHPDIYRETMSELYETIRNVVVSNLRRKTIGELANFVREANLGNEEERKQYNGFYKLTILGDDVKLYSISNMKPDVGEIKLSGLKGRDVVTTDGSVIKVSVPGMPELEIHSLKFRSNMLSAKHGDLKIKTR